MYPSGESVSLTYSVVSYGLTPYTPWDDLR